MSRAMRMAPARVAVDTPTPGREGVAQGPVHPVDGQQLRDGRGLAARDHEAVQPVQLGRPAHEPRFGPQPVEHAPMLAEGALQG